ncbi:MAG: hypothetical protein AB7F35_00690 [Acetobacteraceae bacterium]
MSIDRILQRMRQNAIAIETSAAEAIEADARTSWPSMHAISLSICVAVLLMASAIIL